MNRLTQSEQTFLDKQLKKEKIYLYFCLLDIIAALTFLAYMSHLDSFNSTRFVLIITLLINAKMNFKQ